MEGNQSKDNLAILLQISDKLTSIADNSNRLLEKAMLTHMADSRASANKERAKFVVKLIGEQYESATKYAKVIVMGGYAAFFAAWGSVGEQNVPRVVYITSVVLVGFSVFIFCLFEVYKMYVGTKLHSAYADAVAKLSENIESGNY
ncbi:MAG: hypothetical protein Q7I92_15700 [Humidesulfovibrio sp.]|nr:hypothetical protein [Humidesulfovibrio sp.]